MPAHLPDPSSLLQQHSEKLINFIREDIQKNHGKIPFSRFMQHALYASNLGYYSAGLHKFGKEGDFITAPEISPLFSRCLAHFYHLTQVLPHTQDILEFGAGSGIMAADILQMLEKLGRLPPRYAILETSPELRARQYQTLNDRVPHLLSRIEWLDDWPEAGFCGLVLANEVLDAMPIERLRINAQNETEQSHILWQDQQLVEHFYPPDTTELSRLAHQRLSFGPYPEGYTSEVSLHIPGWIQSLSERMEQGLILLMDYGYVRSEYYQPHRSRGTLRCYHRHQAHDDALWYPGIQDITSHVDFTLCAESADQCGLSVAGFTTQAQFLLHQKIDQFIPQDGINSLADLNITQQIKTLMMSDMGENFKFMALGKNLPPQLASLPGFEHDQRYRL
jgi:SAM-dependent MidA family methyltransferase